MEIEFDLNLKDCKIFQRYALSRLRKKNKGMVLKFVLIWAIAVFFLLYYPWIFGLCSVASLATAVTMTIICVVFILARWIWAAYMLPKADSWTLGKRTMIFKPEGMIIKSNLMESIVKWQAIEEMAQTKEHIFLFVDTMVAFVIPKRVFGSEGEMEKFVEEVGQYMKQI